MEAKEDFSQPGTLFAINIWFINESDFTVTSVDYTQETAVTDSYSSSSYSLMFLWAKGLGQ